MSRRPPREPKPSAIESMARDISSDDPSHWDRMGEPQREYWRRIAGRVAIHQHRLKRAQAEMSDYLDQGSEAA